MVNLRLLCSVLATLIMCVTIVYLYKIDSEFKNILDPKFLLGLTIAALWTDSGKNRLRTLLIEEDKNAHS